MTAFTGLPRMVRLVLRRDRVRLPLWILSLSLFAVASAASQRSLYPDQASIDNYARLFGGNPALVAFAGPGYGFDHPNIGVILVNETQLWLCVGVALMSIFLVNRHTRAEEDAERTEVLRSSVVGRHAPTAAAVAVVTGANLVVAALSAAGFIAFGYATVGSIALAGSAAACGIVFTAVAAVTAQVASGSRATLGSASALLGVAFVLRAVGDIGDNAVRWLSPIGWAQGVRAYAGERSWPVLLSLGIAVTLTAGAFWLSTRRDLGSGLLPGRPGPSGASGPVTTPIGLAVRLQRGPVVGWSIGLFITGAVYGSIGQDVEQMVTDNPTYADFFAQARRRDHHRFLLRHQHGDAGPVGGGVRALVRPPPPGRGSGWPGRARAGHAHQPVAVGHQPSGGGRRRQRRGRAVGGPRGRPVVRGGVRRSEPGRAHGRAPRSPPCPRSSCWWGWPARSSVSSPAWRCWPGRRLPRRLSWTCSAGS